LILPVLLLIGGAVALAILLDSPGPILFKTVRVGRGGRPFVMLKFRKMRDDVAGLPLTLGNDARFTPIGRLLALTKLDELPQILNVLCGDMRLVGPRPELQEFIDKYPTPYDEILRYPPGITGTAQLRFATESRVLAECEDPVVLYCDELLPAKINLDLDYVRTHSILGDLAILSRTAILPLERIVTRFRVLSAGRVRRFVTGAAVVVMLLVLFSWASHSAI
jgi:lipopolysaccharide/colanic/teichoic acid biosynthesis glycosyltransferase